MRSSRLLARLVVALAVLMVLIIVGSWIAAAAWPEANIRSLISFDGVRWMLGSFTDSLLSPLLVWMLVWAVAVGTLRRSGLAAVLAARSCPARRSYRERIALMIVVAELLVAVALLVLTTAVPHAILLNAEGGLYPGVFSRCVVPACAFVVLVCSLSYGMTSGRFGSFADAYEAMTGGIRAWSGGMLLYILVMLVVMSVRFVVGL